MTRYSFTGIRNCTIASRPPLSVQDPIANRVTFNQVLRRLQSLVLAGWTLPRIHVLTRRYAEQRDFCTGPNFFHPRDKRPDLPRAFRDHDSLVFYVGVHDGLQ